MEFKQKRTIYQQIAENICEKIMREEFEEKGKVPSIRSLAVDLQVNPNTVQRTYEYLQQEEIIFTQRGLGYFVSEGAKQRIIKTRKKDFLKLELPFLFKNMELLGINIDTIIEEFKNHKKN